MVYIYIYVYMQMLTRRGEHDRILGNYAESASEIVQGDGGDVDSIDHDSPLPVPLHAEQGLHDGRL